MNTSCTQTGHVASERRRHCTEVGCDECQGPPFDVLNTNAQANCKLVCFLHTTLLLDVLSPEGDNECGITRTAHLGGTVAKGWTTKQCVE